MFPRWGKLSSTKTAVTFRLPQRLKEVFHKNASEFREACYHLLGLRAPLFIPTPQKLLLGPEKYLQL